jgi:hypothetical protein
MAEREHYASDSANRLVASWQQAAKYYEYLEVVVGRHATESQQLVSSLASVDNSLHGRSGDMSPEQVALIRASGRLSILVHLEIESYYTFAKILLDKLALVIQDYFGAERGHSLVSHDKLRKGIVNFAEKKRLALPSDLVLLLDELQRRVVDYRDKQINHSYNQRLLRYTIFDMHGDTRIGGVEVYPTNTSSSNFPSSESIPQLTERIDVYIDRVMELISSNRDRTRHELLEKCSPPLDSAQPN